MNRRILSILASAILCPLMISCLWDRDTLAAEAEGEFDVVHTLIGWFDRYPDAYFEMRLARVRKELAQHPDRLNLYDDAAVALDRLHRSDDAIAMMLEKKKKIDLLTDGDEKNGHQYRYLANLGTFYAHRWVGKKREVREADYSDLGKAEELLEAAIELNPDAHFGREKYQLLTLRWLNPERYPNFNEPGRWPSLVTEFEDYEPEEVIEGLTGMMRLGAAWESVDIHAALAQTLSYQEQNSLALLADLRLNELLSNGLESLHSDPTLREEIPSSIFIQLQDQEPVIKWFKEARAVTDERNALRLKYMQERLKLGQHPDTHPDFWGEWRELELPELPNQPAPDRSGAALMRAGILAVCGLLAVVILLGLWLKRVNQKSAERIDFKIG